MGAAGSDRGAVLVVEDDASIRLLLRRILEGEGWRVAEAADGPAALALAAAERPAAVLLDIGLPGMDGMAVLERLGADPDLTGVPVLMVTAWNEPERIERALAAGARGYVRKPFDAAELLSALAAVAG